MVRKRITVEETPQALPPQPVAATQPVTQEVEEEIPEITEKPQVSVAELLDVLEGNSRRQLELINYLRNFVH